MPDESQNWIWLEVTEVRYDTDPQGGRVSVSLKGDREHPKPVWWPVEGTVAGASALETYKAILNELDKKRVALARLTYNSGGNSLFCNALRFQTPELGSR
jgi:hypothetical protein